MISDLLGVTGSGMAGSLIGLFSAHLKYKSDALQIKQLRKCDDAHALVEHLNRIHDKPYFSFSVGMLVTTVCACALMGINEPSLPLWTFYPSDEPQSVEFLWFKYQWHRTEVFQITTGGVAYGLLHAIVFQIGRILSGVR